MLLVGAGTVRAEGYGGDHQSSELRALRARRGLSPAPRIAVVTRRLAMTPDDPLFTDTEVPPLVVTCAAAPHAARESLAAVADVIVAGDDRVDIGRALDALADRDLRRVSCEGGPTLLAEVTAAGRLDELRLTVAPLLTAGDAPRIAVGPTSPPRAMTLVHALADGDHLFLRYRRAGERG